MIPHSIALPRPDRASHLDSRVEKLSHEVHSRQKSARYAGMTTFGGGPEGERL